MSHDPDASPVRAEDLRDLVARCRVASGRHFRLDRRATGNPVPDLLDKAKGQALLRRGIAELSALQETLYAESTWSLLLVFQAMDAAGKDSTIKHVMTGVNPQGVSVTSFKQPGPEDLAHDFLWRVNRHLPARGMIGIFNRSHYEEVLVARVHPEVLAAQRLPAALAGGKRFWDHRLEDIAGFERHLGRSGTRVLKFFLHVGRDEQKSRFLDRLDEPDKNWKFSPSDLKERGLWGDYMDGLRGGHPRHRHRGGALVRGAGRPQMAHAADRGRGRGGGPARARSEAARRVRCAEGELRRGARGARSRVIRCPADHCPTSYRGPRGPRAEPRSASRCDHPDFA